ncbi:unnamed protein product [Cuscuta campestris]|uniref:Uncharacterized protein n=1 Tax=Cuscuta campestris TaxID=132261 RepID=A0A484KFN2_9ASTE|nr:unnamed protein product [Cuscuta campestris]
MMMMMMTRLPEEARSPLSPTRVAGGCRRRCRPVTTSTFFPETPRQTVTCTGKSLCAGRHGGHYSRLSRSSNGFNSRSRVRLCPIRSCEPTSLRWRMSCGSRTGYRTRPLGFHLVKLADPSPLAAIPIVARTPAPAPAVTAAVTPAPAIAPAATPASAVTSTAACSTTPFWAWAVASSAASTWQVPSIRKAAASAAAATP